MFWEDTRGGEQSYGQQWPGRIECSYQADPQDGHQLDSIG